MALTQGLQLPFGIQPVNALLVDSYAGPYNSVAEALSSIPSALRVQTRFVNIIDSGVGKLYWFKDGIADGDLVEFSSASGTVTSVGLSMPSAFSVANSPVTSSGTLTVTGAGLASQYVRGDGTLGDFPSTTGGGSSVSYYLNGSVNQGTFGGNTYYEMNKTPILGTGTDFSTSSDGYIASFITDVGDPNKLLIPAGNWNLELYFSASSGGGNPSFYVELYKYNGTTFTLIASSSAAPELISLGTSINPYFVALAVPETPLALTDRLALRVYVTTSGRTITLHTEDNHLCQIITTFSTGLTALNGLTAQVQYLTTGTSGTDFNIASSSDTHTFNIPVASATNTGKLSSTDWSTFNSKEPAIAAGTTLQYFRGDKTFQTLNTSVVPESGNLYFTNSRARSAISLTTIGTSGVATYDSGTGVLNIPQYQAALTNPVTGTGTTNYLPKFTGTSAIGDSQVFDNGTNVGIGTTSPSRLLHISSTGDTYLRVDGQGFESLFGSDANGTVINQTGLTGISLRTANSDRMRITAGGRILMGTTSDNGTDRLQVSGSANFSSSVTASSFSGAGTGLTGTASSLSIGGNAATVTNGVYTTGSYANPSWITSLAWSKITGTPAIITGTGANGQIAYWSGTSTQTGNNNLAWDNTNSALNLGGFNFGSSAGISSTINVLSSATTSGVSLKSTNSASSNLSQLGVYLENNAGARSQLYKMNSNGTTYKTIAANDLGFYNGTGSGNIAILNDNASGNISLTAGGSSSPHMIVSSGGNVWIGTSSGSTSASIPLTLNETGTNIGTQILFTNSYATGYVGLSADSRGDITFQVDGTGTGSDKGIKLNTGGNNTRLYITGSGNVGLGTTSPSRRLSVSVSPSAAGDDGILLSNGTNDFIFARTGSSYTYRAVPAGAGMIYAGTNMAFLADNANVSFHNGLGESMRITSGSVVLMGTTTDNYNHRLQVQGIITAKSGDNAVAFDPANRAVNAFTISSGGSASLTLNSNGGNVGIGTTSPSEFLHVAGTGRFNGYVSFNNQGYIRGGTNTLDLQGGTTGTYFYNSSYSAVRMVVLDGGNVGIGTTNPNNTLDVRNTGIMQIRMGTDNGARPYWQIGRDNVTTGDFIIADETSAKFRIANTGAATFSSSVSAANGSFNGIQLGTDNTYGDPYRVVGFGSRNDGGNRIFAGQDGTTSMFFAAATGHGFIFRPNGGTTGTFVIASNGAATFSSSVTANLFIGEFYSSTLHAGINFPSGNTFAVRTGNQDNRLVISSTGAATFSSSVTASSFSATGNGNLGVFTTTGNSVGYGLIAQGTSGGARDIFIAGQIGFSNGFTVQYDGTIMRYAFLNGNIGIGTLSSTNASIPLSLNATGTNIGTQILFTNSYATAYCGISADTRGDVTFQVDGTGSGSDKGIKLNTNGNNTRLYVTNGGEVYIAGLADQGAFNLQVNGTGVWAAGAYVNGSDQRLKENIQDIDKGLEYINKVRPVKFNYKRDYSRDRNVHTGFIAQQLQSVFANEDYLGGMVQEGAHLNVAYQNLIPIMVKAIQEQQIEIENLKAQLK